MTEKGAIYIVEDGKLIAMEEQPYAEEAHLQEFLAQYPKLLAGEQLTPDSPRRWLLVRREMSVPDDEDGGSRWSVDHLFLDQDAIPTLVEVKRSSDTRIRREVVGQMLDYAANAVAYWPIERLQSQYERTCVEDAVDPESRLAEFIGADDDPDSFWEAARTNLQAGRVRLLFVADEIPTELRQIVRFLQTQMNPAEVYAIEVPKYSGESMTALVPRLVTESAPEAAKTSGEHRPKVTRESFLEAVAATGKEALAASEQLLGWAEGLRLYINWGRGMTPSFGPKLDLGGVRYHTFNLYADGRVEVPFGALRGIFADNSRREQLRLELNAAGLDYPQDGIARYPTSRVELLSDSGNLSTFVETWERYIAAIEEAE